MEVKDGVQTFYAEDQKAWRKWLQQHHRNEQSVWLIIYKKSSGVSTIGYSAAVDEALCFGWIDSKPNKRDDKSYYQFFARRKPGSNWSKVNKDKVARLIKQRKMTMAGMKAIEVAKQNGSWTALDAVEALTVPDDMARELANNTSASNHWSKFPRSVQRGILEWILNAKKPATRQKRIEETISLAADNRRANQYVKK